MADDNNLKTANGILHVTSRRSEPLMPPPERVHFPTGIPGLEWLLTDDGSRTLISSLVGEAYHSGCGAAAESLQVYLINSGVAARLIARQPTRVLEVGFGTGTAFYLTAALAEACKVPLHYTALELTLLPAQIFEDFDSRTLNGGHLAMESGGPDAVLWESLLVENIHSNWVAARQGLDETQRTHRLSIAELVQLELVLGDAREFAPTHSDAYHAVYFDPFSPETSPELWTEGVFERMFALLHPLGTLTSYCVKGAVRRKLEAVGFEVRKTPGPVGGKREVLVAIRPAID